jgi:hypothetical protein
MEILPGVNRFGANALTMYQDISRKEKQLQGVCHLIFHLKLQKSEADQYIGGEPSANEFT